MRSEKEIREALSHVAAAGRGARALGNHEAFGSAILMGDILCWCLGEESPFASMLKDWRKVDKDADRAERN